METIGQRVRWAREQREVERKELAKAAGVSYSMLADLENGKAHTTTKLHKIATRLRVRVEWLENGSGAWEASGDEALTDADSIDALRYAVSALVAVTIDHRPREGVDMARALRRHVPPRLAKDGFVSELLKVLDAAQAQSSGLPSRPKR